MSNFSIIAGVLSMVLGLSVTRLLLGLVTVFRIRHTCHVDWVPLVWALLLFATQLEYWWVINQLPLVKSAFTFQEFIFLVMLTLMLFISAALLLPSRTEDEEGGLRQYFERDGRYALLSYSGFLALGFIANVFFLNHPVAGSWAYMDLIMMTVPVLACFSRKRRTYMALTLFYVPLSIFDIALSLGQ